METGDIIKFLRKSKNLSQEELGAIVGVQKSAIAKYENGRVKNLKRETIEKLAKYFDVNPSLLIMGIDAYSDKLNNIINATDKEMIEIDNEIKARLEQQDRKFINQILEAADKVEVKLPYPTHVISIPIYDAISCGTGGFIDDNIIDTITIPAEMLKNPNKEFFGQYANGDSMIEADINDGDLLIFEKNNFIEKGEIGCFCIDDNVATCKKYTIAEDNVIYLMPANSNYAPIRVDVTNEAFRIIGKLAVKISKQK